MDVNSRRDLDVWVCLLNPLEIVLAVMLTRHQLYIKLLYSYINGVVLPILIQVVVAGDEIVELLHVLE